MLITIGSLPDRFGCGVRFPASRENMRNSPSDIAVLRRALLSILIVLLGAAVAIGGSHVGGPPVVVGGVAVIVLGARLLRPLSPRVLHWLDGKGA